MVADSFFEENVDQGSGSDFASSTSPSLSRNTNLNTYWFVLADLHY